MSTKVHQTLISKEQRNLIFHEMLPLIISEYLHNMLHLFIDLHFLSRSLRIRIIGALGQAVRERTALCY